MTATAIAQRGHRLARGKTYTLPCRGGGRENAILACLPDTDFDALKHHGESVDVRDGQMLCAPGEPPSHVWFPLDAVVSVAAVLGGGDTRMEMASVGREGMVGVGVFLGGVSTCTCAVVQRAGALLQVPAHQLIDLFERSGPCQHLLLRCAHSLLVEVSQLAACNRLHSLHQRLCRWLLLNHDISPGSEILHSHEAISDALGVRREGVTLAAGRLRDHGAIFYDRGRITVLNKEKLETQACECYARLRKERKRLLPRRVAT